jgi:hypothetical protein
LSWRQTLRPTTRIFIFKPSACSYSPYVTSSMTKGWVCRLQFLLGLASAVILRSESRGTHDHVLLSQVRDSSNLEGQVPVLISPRNRVARLYPQTLGSLFITSYDSKGYGVDIRPRLSTGFHSTALLILFRHGPLRKHLLLSDVSSGLLPGNCCCFQSHYLATGLHAAIHNLWSLH